MWPKYCSAYKQSYGKDRKNSISCSFNILCATNHRMHLESPGNKSKSKLLKIFTERERESPKSSREGGWSGGATVLAARCQAFTVKSMDFFTV